MKELTSFFQPKSVAVIGASPNIESINGKLIKYLQKHNYKGEIYPVNPKYQEIAGLKCYHQLSDIDEDVDMALLAISSSRMLPVLKQCATKKVKAAIVFSAGFAETGEDGRVLQEKIKEISSNSGIAICGPNCLGTINLIEGIVLGFSTILEAELKRGPVGFVSQSGAFGFATFSQAQDENIGFSYLVATGNEVDLSTSDFIDYMVNDNATSVILCYMEGLKDGECFKKAAEKALRVDKPLIIQKVGRSSVGIKAIASHTAVLTGSDEIFDAFFKQKSVIRANHSDDLMDMAKIFANKRRPHGKKVGILTTSGGSGIMAADTFTLLGLDVPELEQSSRDKIKNIIPYFGSTINPVDITAQVINDYTLLTECLQVLVNDPNLDCVMISLAIVGESAAENTARGIVNVYKKNEKPMAVSWGASDKLVGSAFSILSKAGVPLYRQPVRCARAMSALVNYTLARQDYIREDRTIEDRTILKTEQDCSFIRESLQSIPNNILTEHQAKNLLASAGIPVTREYLVQSREDALAAADKIGYPIVLKVMSPKILHKTEAGVLALNLANDAELEEAYDRIYANALANVNEDEISGVLVQEMAPKGIEAIIGVKNDPQFGPTIMFGLGGIFVEVLKDITLKVAPLSRKDATDMLDEIKGKKLLLGYRGEPAVNPEALIDVILQVSHIAMALKDNMEEMDINPILLYPDSVKVVDALIIKR